jgi:hypothetical protein
MKRKDSTPSRLGSSVKTGLTLACAALVGWALLFGSAAPAGASSGYTICEGGGSLCLNSPGFGNNVRAVSSLYAAYYAVNATTWDGHDVAEQQVGNGPNCLQANGSTLDVFVTTCTSGRASQEWWWDPSNHHLVNVYLTSHYGVDWYMYGESTSSTSDAVILQTACTNPSGCIGPPGTPVWDSNNGVTGP